MRLALLGLVLAAGGPPPAGPPAPRADRHGDPLPPGAALRLGTVRFSQGFMVAAAQFAPDGKTIALSGPGRNRIGLFDAATGRLVRDLGDRQWEPRSLAFSPDGAKLLAAGYGEGGVALDVGGGDAGRRFPGWAWGAAWSPDGKTVATGGNREVRLFDADTGGAVATLGPFPADFSRFAFTAAGRLAAAFENGDVIVTDAAGRQLHRWNAGGPVHAFAPAPDGKRLLVGRPDHPTRLVDLATGTTAVTLGPESESGRAAAFTPDGAAALVGAKRGKVTVYDTATWKPARTLDAGSLVVSCLAVSPDGQRAATANAWNSGVRVWEIATGRELTAAAGRHVGPVDVVQPAPDGKTLFSWGREKKLVRWDLATGAGADLFAGPDDGLLHTAPAIAPDGGRLTAATGRERKLRLIDTRTGTAVRELATLPPPSRSFLHCYPVAFSPDGGRLAVGLPDGVVRVYDPATGAEVATFAGSKLGRPVTSLRFRPDGTELLVGLDRGNTPYAAAVRWDPAGGRAAKWVNIPHQLWLAVPSPDGSRIVACPDWGGPPTVWDGVTGNVLYRLDEAKGGCYAAAFSPDGLCLATGGTEARDTVHVWEAATGQELATFRGHHSSVTALAFSADGRRVVSGGGDSTLLVWDLTGRSGGLGDRPATPAEAWRRLASSGGPGVLPAYFALADDPAGGVAFLAKQLKPAAAPPPGRVAKLVAGLDAPAFADREKATAALLRLGQGALPDLRAALNTAASAEVRDRLKRLIDRAESGPDATAARRGVALLARLRTPDAIALLQRLADGVAAPQTSAARDALAAVKSGGRP